MTFLEYVNDNIHRIVKPFRSKFQWDAEVYQSRREYWTLIILMASTALNVLAIIL